MYFCLCFGLAQTLQHLGTPINAQFVSQHYFRIFVQPPSSFMSYEVDLSLLVLCWVTLTIKFIDGDWTSYNVPVFSTGIWL